MAIQLSGIASGLDTGSIVTQLVAAEGQPMQLMQKNAAALRAASTHLSSIGSTLSNLRSAANALSLTTQVGSYTASSSDISIVAAATASAATGSYSFQVNSIASEQRTYTASFSDHTGALGQAGTFTLQSGAGAPATVTVTATDTLDSIAGKINGAGVRAMASVFYDGSQYRLQVRGLDTGTANALTFTESGTALDLNGTGATPTSGRTGQLATNATATIDGFTVTSSTNQFANVIPGVSLAVSHTTSSPATISIAADTASFAQKINAVVGAYNAVVTQVHGLAGYGSTKGSDPKLAADRTLRSITDKLSKTVTSGYGSGTHNILATIGITSNKDGTLTVDSTKLAAAFTSDASGVQALLGRPVSASSGGAMATLRDVVDDITNFVSGPLTSRKDQFTSQAARLDSRAANEQRRLDSYQTILQKQFSAMETTYSRNQALGTQISRIG